MPKFTSLTMFTFLKTSGARALAPTCPVEGGRCLREIECEEHWFFSPLSAGAGNGCALTSVLSENAASSIITRARLHICPTNAWCSKIIWLIGIRKPFFVFLRSAQHKYKEVQGFWCRSMWMVVQWLILPYLQFLITRFCTLNIFY